MGEIIYRDKSGYQCNDKRVHKFWLTGSISGKDRTKMMQSNIVFKKGKQWVSEEIVVSEDDYDTAEKTVIEKAELYLMSTMIATNETRPTSS